MKDVITLSSEEEGFVRGLMCLGIYVGNLFVFCKDEWMEKVMKFADDMRDYELCKRSLENALPAGMADDHREMAYRRLEADHAPALGRNENAAFVYGIKAWFEKNLIVRIKRPDTIGNKGDYVGDNPRIDAYYASCPQFAKFVSRDAYDRYCEALHSDDEADYRTWYSKNISDITEINITKCDLPAFDEYVRESV